MTIINARAAGFALLLAGLAPVLAGCNEPKDAVAAAPAENPEVEVSIVTVKPQARAIVRELPGRIAPTRVADVRSRVSGIIIERAFHQGTEVKAGDTLYRIDPKPFEVELQAAKASLQKAEAAYETATLQARRLTNLAQQKAVSEAEGERALGAQRQAEAEIAARKADVARARLNLDYATIRAPIDGIVGAALVTEGTLIAQNDTTNLATIQQLDPIYADFTQSVSEMNNLRRAFETGDLERIAPDAAKVRLVFDDGSIYPLVGKLLFSEAKVDTFTGQVTLRGEFPNPKRELLPGMYVRVQIVQGEQKDALSVPERALQRDPGGQAQLYVVNAERKAELRSVTPSRLVNGRWIIKDGLKAGETVVVEGFQTLAPGAAVDAKPWRSQTAAK